MRPTTPPAAPPAPPAPPTPTTPPTPVIPTLSGPRAPFFDMPWGYHNATRARNPLFLSCLTSYPVTLSHPRNPCPSPQASQPPIPPTPNPYARTSRARSSGCDDRSLVGRLGEIVENRLVGLGNRLPTPYSQRFPTLRRWETGGIFGGEGEGVPLFSSPPGPKGERGGESTGVVGAGWGWGVACMTGGRVLWWGGLDRDG